MDAEDIHDGGRNYRPCMDSFGVNQFQGIMEKYLIILGHQGIWGLDKARIAQGRSLSRICHEIT